MADSDVKLIDGVENVEINPIPVPASDEIPLGNMGKSTGGSDENDIAQRFIDINIVQEILKLSAEITELKKKLQTLEKRLAAGQ